MNEDSTSLYYKTATDPKQTLASTIFHQIQRDEPAASRSTYDSFFCSCIYSRHFVTRLANDLFLTIMRYWFPNHAPLPYHLMDLLRTHERLRLEHDLRSFTYSRYNLVKRSYFKPTSENSTQTISLVAEKDATFC